MRLLATWHFWTWCFAMYGFQHAIHDVATWAGVAPAQGSHSLWYSVLTFALAIYGGAYLMYKTLEEAERAGETQGTA